MTAPTRRPRGRAMSLVFRFEVQIDDRRLEVANRPGDAIRLRQDLGGGDALDTALAAGGVESYEVLLRFCWRAIRHHDDYAALDWESFLDRVEGWTVLDDEAAGEVRPTDAAPPNA